MKNRDTARAIEVVRYRDGQPILARPASFAMQLFKLCRRHPVTSAISAVAALAVVVSLGVSLWFNARLSESLQIVEQQRAEAGERQLALRRHAYTSDLTMAGHNGRQLLAA